MKATIRIVLACICTFARFDHVQSADQSQDSLSTIKANVEQGVAVLIDVREKSEWDDGHLEAAIFLPLSAIQDGLSKDELAKLPKDKILYIHCKVGKRAATAGHAIEKAGRAVRPIKAGYQELIAAGLPKAKP